MSKSQGDGASGKVCSSREAPPSGSGDEKRKDFSTKEENVGNIKMPNADDVQADEGDRQKVTEDELKQLKEFIAETEEKINFKIKLREENHSASENPPDESFFRNLDSNLKKTSAFVKKLKTVTESQKDSLIKDCKTFNLTRYIGEIAVALVEAKLKMSDIHCVLTICSLVHQRYSEFSKTLLEHWQKNLMTKKDGKPSNLSKLRVDLRLFADLISAGVLPEKDSLNMLAGQLNLLTCNDKEEFNNLPIVISFCRHCGDDYAGLVPQRMKELAEKYRLTIPYNQFLKSDRQKACRSLLRDYYLCFSKYVTAKCREMRDFEKQNRKILKTRGELAAERKEKFEACQQNFSKLQQNAAILADLLSEPLPYIPEEESKPEEEIGGDALCALRGGELGEAHDGGLFEDEDTRQFYELLPDLKSLIPGILYKDSEQAVANNDLPTDEDLEITDDLVSEEVKESKVDEPRCGREPERVGETNVEAEIEEEATAGGGSMRDAFEAFLGNLPNSVNRELVDKAAIEFCMNFNNKANRRRLARTLYGVPRTRYDLLPFYSRLVATLNPCMPGLSVELAALLKDEFGYTIRKKDQINIESKLKIVRFLGELAKFSMISKSEALFCLKRLYQDFTHHNIEMACTFLETCGRFLYKSADSHYRMKNYLDVMMRKKSAQHLDTRYLTMIENAYYYSNPPEDTKRETQKTLPPVFQYVERLLFKDLSKVTVDRVLKQLRKLNWNDPEVASFAVKSFSSIWNARYNCIHCCANLLSGLSQFQEEVAYRVVDSVLEHVRLGMEMIHPSFNQNRLSVVKYLGELYNFKVIESQIIFKTLYLFISFETSLDATSPSPLDPPDYLFRIRLICVLLETCGTYFNAGMSKKKLDCFLLYFQRYYWFKKSCHSWNDETPFPREVDNLVVDMFRLLRPKMVLYKSFDEASKAAGDADEEFKAKIVESMKVNQNGSNNELSTIMETENECTDEDAATLKGSQESENDMDVDSVSLSHKEDGDTDDELVDASEDDSTSFVSCKFRRIKTQEDDDFNAALDRMMTEVTQARQQENTKIPAPEIVIPYAIKSQSKSKIMGNAMSSDANVSAGAAVPYKILCKKGSKQHFATLAIPLTQKFVSNYREHKKFELEEKEEMKRVVLEIHERQEEEHYQAEMLAQQQALGLGRERRGNYNYPRGAPDADAIFGYKRH